MAEAPPAPAPSREGYDPEWLAYEDLIGMRPAMSGNQEVDIPIFNQMGVQLGSMWPKVEGPLDITEDVYEPGSVKVRVYRPSNADKTLPCMVYFHGGGFISGNLDTEDVHCQILATKTPCVVMSIDYPLASPPGNHPIDEIIDSGVQAVNWAKENASKYGADPGHILVAGGSAGACLAIQVLSDFITKGSPGVISGAVLFFGFCSPMPYEGPHKDLHNSYVENANGAPFLSYDILIGMWKTNKADFSNPRHFPMLSPTSHWSQWPPTYFCAAEKDPERDDSVVLSKLLHENNVPVKIDTWKGFPHYFHWFPTVPSAAKCMDKGVEGTQFVILNQKK